MSDVSIKIYNYTARARAYTILATWPEKSGGTMKNNVFGGRKEATGVWAWKLETLQPGENITITFSLNGLEKGDWTETDVFYRGSQEIIGALKMDEKYLAIQTITAICVAAGFALCCYLFVTIKTYYYCCCCCCSSYYR